MKRPIEPRESDEVQDQAPSPAPKPFDIFAGLLQEPLPPVQGEANSVKPTGALIQQEDGAPKAAIAKPDQVLSHPGKRNSWMLALIALVTLLLGVVIGFALK